MEIFSYSFMQRAFIVATLISIISALIGNTIVLKRLSSIGDALSHSSLAGIGLGLILGLNPVFIAVLFSIFCALGIDYIKRHFPKYAEISTNVILSLGVGLSALFSGLVKNPTSFNSFLFGSIVAISNVELYVILFLSILVIIVCLVLYREIFHITFDSESANISGIKTRCVNFIFTILTAVVISISCRTVGSLVISSLLTLPVACALLISKSYKHNLILSIFFAFLFTIVGLLISCYHNLKPGGTIVLLGVIVLLILLPFRKK